MALHHLTGRIISSTCPRPTPNGRSRWSRIGWLTCSVALDETKLQVQKDVVKNEYRQNYPNRPYGRVWPLVAEALYPAPASLQLDDDRRDGGHRSGDHRRMSRRFSGGSMSRATPAWRSSATWTRNGRLRSRNAISSRFPAGPRRCRPWVPDAGLKETTSIVLHDRVELDRLYLIWPTRSPLSQRRRGPGSAGRRSGSREIEPSLSQAGDRGRDCPGRDGLSIGPGAGRLVWDRRDAATVAVDRVRREAWSSPSSSALRPRASEADELRRVQNLRVAGFYFALEHMGGFGGVADRLNAYNVFRGDPSLITTDVERFQTVSARELQSVAKRYLAGRPRVELSVVGREKSAVAAPLDRSVVPAESAPPSAIGRRCRGSSTLPCRHPALGLPAQRSADRGGLDRRRGWGEPPAAGSSRARSIDAPPCSRRAPPRERPQQIALAAESMGATIAAGCGWDGSYVSFKCLREDLHASLDLAVDILLNPTFPETEWGRVRGQTLAALQSRARQCRGARDTGPCCKALYAGDHPYRFPLAGTEASVAGLTRGRPGAVSRAVRGRRAGRRSSSPATSTRTRWRPSWSERLTSWIGLPDGPPVRSLPPTDLGHPRMLLLDRPGAPQAVVRAGHVGLARIRPRLRTHAGLEPDPGRPIHLAAQRQAARGTRLHLRRSQLTSTAGGGPGPFSISAGRPERPARRGTRRDPP